MYALLLIKHEFKSNVYFFKIGKSIYHENISLVRTEIEIIFDP